MHRAAADDEPILYSAGMQDLFEDDNAALLVHENDVDPSSEEEDLADQDSNGAWALLVASGHINAED